jgi:hypothetical protein
MDTSFGVYGRIYIDDPIVGEEGIVSKEQPNNQVAMPSHVRNSLR